MTSVLNYHKIGFKVNILERDILKVLTYFDMFHYLLSEWEIKSFLQRDAAGISIRYSLEQMTLRGCIFHIDNFYSLHDDPHLVQYRISGNHRAKIDLLIAFWTSKFLFKFPFVRGISISGSLSKNFADEKSDIDYFIITARGKLWIARTLLHLFKKLTYLFKAQHRYCMNYFVDEQALEIEEKNIYTAMEIVTLLPICGNGIHEKFFALNKWVCQYLPNCNVLPNEKYYTGKRPVLKTAVETLLNNRFGDRIDNFFLKVTSYRWRRKERNHRLNIKGNRMGFICKKHCCKPDPQYFQTDILKKYYTLLSGSHLKDTLTFKQTH